ncbi:hypothetical protein V492_00682 [Pseudogymnoascus sp. VKM F-4246]|nr:hypothetical protein V492_00682 [Pseudogymnoascus sp. VKM F-4246]
MVSFKIARAKYGVVLSLCVSVIASPFYTKFNNSREDIRRRSEDFYLQIMPLGASITYGEPAAPGTNGNGYRKLLRDQLRFDGWQVNMVGSQSHGTMGDSDNEGYPGAVIAQINNDHAKAALSAYKPNVVLINAGTNDATKNNEVNTAGDRMRDMVMECFIRVPGTVVILSTLLPQRDAPTQIAAINDQYRNVVAQLRSQGFHIVLADMNDGFITIDDIWDGTHPYLAGFQKMAAVWRHATNEAEKEGWFTKPSDDVTFEDASHGTTCPKILNSGGSDPRAGMQILTANTGLVYDDGPYVHSSTKMSAIFGGSKVYRDGQFYLAQLVNLDNVGRGGERDDLVYVSGSATKTTIFINQGDGTLGPPVDIDVHDSCGTIGIRWGDVNNDGLDDFICIGPEGNMYVSINLGGNPPQFKSLGGTYFTHPEGYSQANVQLGDIDGDGRLDYCVVAGNGDIRCWRNGGLTDVPEYWQDLGKVSPGRNLDDINSVRFVDLNGDARSDLLYVDKEGQVNTFINQRGDGDGMAPKWLSSGVTHVGQGEDTKGRTNIIFGQLYSERADYVYIQRTGADTGSKATTVIPWKNEGSGGKHQKGDGAHWGDMDGNGNDDYVWISPDGKVTIFRNLNAPPDTSKFNGGGGWDAAKVNLETGFDRKALHVGDWDGDGKADIIGVDKGSGAVTIWKTNYAGPHQFSFTKEVIPNSGVCNQGWGDGLFDIGVIFADITGSGRVDYLCIHPDGTVFGWLNDKDSTMRSVGQVKFSEKYDRANHRFADVNGDGRADFMWVDKMNGDAKVWYNLGELPDGNEVSGSSFRWSLQGKLYAGAARGPNLHFPNIGGQGRADMVMIEPSTAHGFIWYNSCPRGGDDGPIVDPKLPAYNPSGPINPTDPSDSDNAAKFCGVNEGSWTTNLWNDLGVGNWFDQRSRLYASYGWPIPTDISTSIGIPIVLARFDFLSEDKAFNWPSECQDIHSTCAVTKSTVGEKCEDNWQRAFTLFSIGNYARFLQNFISALLLETDGTALSIGRITDVMIPDQQPDPVMDAAAWLSFFGGLAGAIGAVPGAGTPTALVSAGLSVGGSLLGAAESVKDPRFTTFASLSNDFGTMVDLAVDAAAAYFNNILTTLPPNNDAAQGTVLSEAMKSGVFANQYIASGDTSTIDHVLLRKMYKAPIISEVWNGQRLFIAKFPQEKLNIRWDLGGHTWYFDPCYGVPDYGDTLKGKYYCPHGERGAGEYNYLMMSWDTDQGYMYNDYGNNDEKLDEFDIKLSELIISAGRLQNRAREFIPRKPNVMSDIFNEMAQDATQRPDLNDVLFVNIPVCDLTHLDLEWTAEICFIPWQQDDNTLFLSCLNYVLLNTCVKYKLDDKPWPYEANMHGFDTV